MENTELEARGALLSGFTQLSGIVLESWERDRAVYQVELGPEGWNPYGMAHGGLLYTLADDAGGTTAHSDGRYYVTQSGGLHFLDNRAHGKLHAAGRVIHRGKSTVLVDVDVTDDDGVLLATGQFTYFCVDDKRMQERAKET